MLDKITFDEALKGMLRDYISENLSVSVVLDTHDNGDPRSVEVVLKLDGQDISSTTDWF